MSIPLRESFRRSISLVAAFVLLAACGGEPTAPDPLDADSMATRLENLSRGAPREDGVILSAAGVHFRAAGRVTPIEVIIDGRRETWYAASSELVLPSVPCLVPSFGLPCRGLVPLEQRHLYAVDGVDARRLLIVSSFADGSGSFDQQETEWPEMPATGILLRRGRGVQAFASGGSMTSSLTATLEPCPEQRRGPAHPPIESCDRVSIAWQVDAEMSSVREVVGETVSVLIPTVDVPGARTVFAPWTR